MSKVTDSLAKRLDDCIIENFADIYEMEAELERIAKKHDLAEPDVIAAIATVADVGAAQARLTAQPAKALVKGLKAALAKPLRPPAKLLVEALLDGAERSAQAKPRTVPKKLPAFANPARLPPLEGDVDALLAALMSNAEVPPNPSKPQALARFGRALALGWLSHGAEPKHAWAARAAGHFPDDATARDLGMMARELGPRVGQFSKAQILVDVLAAMNGPVALEMLHELSTKVKTKSVKDRARAAFEAAAKSAGVSQLDLADKLPLGKDFARRLEQRMVTGAAMPAVEFVENILQRDDVRARARGVVFGVRTRTKLVTFTIDDGDLVNIEGKRYVLPSAANVVVVHPIDLSAKDLAKWQAQRVEKAPFAQLDRPVMKLGKKTVATAKQGAIYGLESHGWQRETAGGRIVGMKRELDGLTVTIEIEPGIYLGRGMGATDQRITKLTLEGDGSPRARSEIARELDTLTR
jgi:hypothetical protein